jgi:hypothetical protein
MKNKLILTTVLSIFAFSGAANAQAVGSGTLGVTADVEGSLLVTLSTGTAGLAMTGTGTAAGSLPLGTVSMFGGSVPTNVTKTVNGVTGFTLSTPIAIQVDLANTTSESFNMVASLTTADPLDIWSINSIAITNTPATIITAGAYATNTSYPFSLFVPIGQATGTITNTINFTATAN